MLKRFQLKSIFLKKLAAVLFDSRFLKFSIFRKGNASFYKVRYFQWMSVFPEPWLDNFDINSSISCIKGYKG